MNSFPGGVFAGRGRAAAQLRVRGARIEAETQEGERYELPVDDAVYELGGASGEMLFCRRRDGSLTLYSEAPGFRAAVLAAAGRARGALLELERGHRARRRARWLGWAAAALALVALAVGLPAALRWGAERAVRGLPPSVDVQLGQLATDLGGPVVEDPAVQRAADALLAHLLAGTSSEGFAFSLKVVRNPEANAFALPGGRMVLWTGLLERAERADQVAGVLAHEIAHVTERHGLERLAQSLGLVGALQLLFGDAGGLAGGARDLFALGAINQYSRQQEAEADAVGARLLWRVGLSPAVLADFLERLAQPAAVAPPAWLSTHPDLGARVAALRALAASLGPVEPRPLPVSLAALRGDAP